MYSEVQSHSLTISTEPSNLQGRIIYDLLRLRLHGGGASGSDGAAHEDQWGAYDRIRHGCLRIICSCCNSTNHSNLTVAAGTTVGVIDCTQPAKYGSRLIIEEGATVGELNLVNASFSDMDIRGTVNKITYQGVEYTLEELKALGL